MQKFFSLPNQKEFEAEAAQIFGKHVSPVKAGVLLVVTMLVCTTPMLLALRVWDNIPLIVETGLIGKNGEDDSIPRTVLVYGIPGLMCLLNLICHGQLYINQQRMTLPKTPVRLLGRWGIPVIATFFPSTVILRAAQAQPDSSFYTACVLGLLLLLLGSRMWDCKQEARLGLHFSFVERSPAVWNKTHRLAACLWLGLGLLILVLTMLLPEVLLFAAPLALVGFLLPLLFARLCPQ